MPYLEPWWFGWIRELLIIKIIIYYPKSCSEAKAGWILGQFRRLLACLFISSQASCLLARMGYLGEGAKECAARRMVALAEEERMRKEGEAFYAAHIRGRGRWRGS